MTRRRLLALLGLAPLAALRPAPTAEMSAAAFVVLAAEKCRNAEGYIVYWAWNPAIEDRCVRVSIDAEGGPVR